MSNPALCEEITAKSYQELTANFDWSIAERELGYRKGDPLNIGWMCSDRICRLGMADKLALDWEDYQGNHERFTFDDLRLLSNGIAQFISELGHSSRRTRLLVHGSRARSVHWISRNSKDGSGGATPVFRLRR